MDPAVVPPPHQTPSARSTAPPSAHESYDMDDNLSRVADYLDDRLQTPADLDALDDLLATITTQHGLLKQQLHDAQRDLHQAKDAAHAHHDLLSQRANAFRHEQADIDRRLMVITASETSDDAVPRFEQVLDALHRLDVASSYVELLAEVDMLRYDSSCRTSFLQAAAAR
jgi:chromosome segregation ATPase